MDLETNKILSDGEKMRQTLETEGWQLMAERLDKIIAAVTDIRSFKGLPREQFAEELQRRLDAVALVEEWLADVQGEVMRTKEIAQTMISRETHTYIVRK